MIYNNNRLKLIDTRILTSKPLRHLSKKNRIALLHDNHSLSRKNRNTVNLTCINIFKGRSNNTFNKIQNPTGTFCNDQLWSTCNK